MSYYLEVEKALTLPKRQEMEVIKDEKGWILGYQPKVPLSHDVNGPTIPKEIDTATEKGY
jgi:hypothetical protein